MIDLAILLLYLTALCGFLAVMACVADHLTKPPRGGLSQ
jgi:hypothetical protein